MNPQAFKLSSPPYRLGVNPEIESILSLRSNQTADLRALVDAISGVLIGTSACFAPWAFGCVHPWAIATLNGFGFALGILLAAKILLTWTAAGRSSKRPNVLEVVFPFVADLTPFLRRLFLGLLGASIALPMYVLVHAINAKAAFDPEILILNYRENFLPFLPHSFDQTMTWRVFWQYCALIVGFWSTLSWLLGERTGKMNANRAEDDENGFFGRTTRILALLTISGTLMAIQALLQRASGNEALLWLHTPAFPRIDSHFGPFAYRGNASAYFNLIWPAAVVFLVASRKRYQQRRAEHRPTTDFYLWLYPITILLASVPLITGSRGGAIVLLFNVSLIICAHLRHSRNRIPLILKSIASVGLAAVVVSHVIGLEFVDRIQHLKSAIKQRPASIERLEIYQNSIEMSQNHRLWGIGPGAFASAYGMHRGTKAWRTDNYSPTVWSVWVHSDPLETFLTFGIAGTVIALGFTLGLIAFAMLLLKTGNAPTIQFSLPIGLSGCCLHSTVDFPFQIHSLLHTYLLIAAIAISIGISLIKSKSSKTGAGELQKQ